jgi:hypothetical protein
MGDKLAQSRRKELLSRIVQMALITAKDHLVFGERRFDCGDCGLRQIAGELYTADLSRVFGSGDMVLENLEQMVRIRLRLTDEPADEIAEDKRARATGKHPDEGVLGLVNG